MGAKPLVDIIVTHHNEPWDVGKKFFDMIEHQLCVGREGFAITLVQDGKENALPWEELLSSYSFPVRVLTIPHAGPAAARNAGIKNTKGEWIMFCDFDDMFADVCSLKMILNVFPTDDYDIVWGKYVTQEKWNAGSPFINTVKESTLSNTDCKIYRRKFLEEKNLSFNTSVPYYYEYMFNDLAREETEPYRIAALTTDFYVYAKTFRQDSLRNNPAVIPELIKLRKQRDLETANILKKRGHEYAYIKKIAGIVFMEYFKLYDPEKEQDPVVLSDEFIEFYVKYRNVFEKLSKVELNVIQDAVESEVMSMIQGFYNNIKVEYYLVNDMTTFDEWLKALNDKIDNGYVVQRKVESKPVVCEPETHDDREPVVVPIKPYALKGEDYSITPPSAAPADHEPRVAVYCGTYNTYANMLASAKSLLWNTKMDKIYFLIEDDTFPYEIPDIIECINVRDQKFFPENGPNYDNAWSYMCMMRAAFTKYFPQYKKIISFDIDVVINDDIGCLFDIDMSDYYLAGVPEPQRQKSSKDPMYINFGVVIMNLEKLRNDGVDDKIINALNATKFGCPEQDAFNKFCAWHIYKLPNDYNATIHSHITGEAEKERIIHFAGIKYWRHYGQVKEYGDRNWDLILQKQEQLK